MNKYYLMMLATVFTTAGQAADLAAGKQKAQEVCASCHGLDGKSPSPEFPVLAGQHRDYLAKALRDYQSGVRKNGIMAGFANGLSAKDIANLAAWYASQQPALHTRY